MLLKVINNKGISKSESGLRHRRGPDGSGSAGKREKKLYLKGCNNQGYRGSD